MQTTSARILADAVAHDLRMEEVRLTTYEVTFPRFILAEVNTHRALSRNSASSRAIPPEKHIERIRSGDFFTPVFGSRVKGMGQGDDLTDAQQTELQEAWVEAALNAAGAAEWMIQHGSDKSHANRVMEPYMWHTAILSGTEWGNWYALRDHPAAAPEIQALAKAMRAARDDSDPRRMIEGDWSCPLLTEEEERCLAAAPKDDRFWPLVSAGRCARVSFETHGAYEDPEESHARGLRLLRDPATNRPNGHWSPLEHPSRVNRHEFRRVGSNFARPWRQLRKMFPDEHDFSRLR